MYTNAGDDGQIIDACKAAVQAYELFIEYSANVSAAKNRQRASDKPSMDSWEAGRNHAYQRYQNTLAKLGRLLPIHEVSV